MSADLVPVPSLLLDRLAGLGVDVERVLADARLPRSRFQGPRAKLTSDEFLALWRTIDARAPRRDLGLRLGADSAPHQIDVASLAALHAASLADALGKLARYKRISCAPHVWFDVAGDEAHIGFAWAHDLVLPAIMIDGLFASVLTLARRGTGAVIVPRRLELARRRSDAAMFERHFGCPVHFDAAGDRLVLPADVLERPFVTHNADIVAMLVPGLEAELAASAPRSLADDVRAALARRMSGERPSVEATAAALRLSARTLQRRLGELGTSYQAILDQVREHTARRLLVGTDLDASEIAFLLGFEELNSFTRAFTTWVGTTPTRWREGERAGYSPSQ